MNHRLTVVTVLRLGVLAGVTAVLGCGPGQPLPPAVAPAPPEVTPRPAPSPQPDRPEPPAAPPL